MNERRKTKAQLIEELQILRQRLQEAETPQPPTPDPLATDPATLERFLSRGAWIVDTDFVVRVANEAMCRMLDKPAEEIVGTKCYDLAPGPRCHTDQCAMRRAFADAGSRVTEEDRIHLGRVPIACRVVAHLVHDKSGEPMGVVEQLEDHSHVRKPAARPRTERVVAAPRSAPMPNHQALARVALEVAALLEQHRSDDPSVQAAIDKLLDACAPFNPAKTPPEPSPEPRNAKLREVAQQRSVLIVAPQSSPIRLRWSEVVRRAGYAICQDDGSATKTPDGLTVVILDLSLGESIVDELHRRVRREHASVPVLVVSSRTDSLEARRWRRAHTWYVPRSIDGDELVRLIADVTPRPALRTRPER